MSRDFVLARLAVARATAARITAELDEAVDLFAMPEEDPRGRERLELFESVVESAGRLSRLVERAQAVFETIDASEPSPEESDDEEDEAEIEDPDR